MTPEDKELLSEKIVALCHFSGRFGYPEERIARGLVQAGFSLTSEELERELRYLEGKTWIAKVPGDLRPDLRRWTSTATGDEFLMRRGLI